MRIFVNGQAIMDVGMLGAPMPPLPNPPTHLYLYPTPNLFCTKKWGEQMPKKVWKYGWDNSMNLTATYILHHAD